MSGWRTTWKIARWEFTTTVLRAGFLLALVGLPAVHIGLAALMGLGVQAAREAPERPIAVVDARRVLGESNGSDKLVRDEAAAMRALRDGQLDAVFVLDDDYVGTGRVRAYARPGRGLIQVGERLTQA